MALKTDYKDDVLDTSQNENRVYDLVDANGKVVVSNVTIQDKSVYTQKGSKYGSLEINSLNTIVNELSDGGAGIKSITQAEYNALPTDKKNKGSYHITDATEGYTIGDVIDRVTEIEDGLGTIPSGKTVEGQISEINSNLSTLNTEVGNINVYVGSDSKLHFVDKDGADSALPFSSKINLLNSYWGTYSNGINIPITSKSKLICFTLKWTNTYNLVINIDNKKVYYNELNYGYRDITSSCSLSISASNVYFSYTSELSGNSSASVLIFGNP